MDALLCVRNYLLPNDAINLSMTCKLLYINLELYFTSNIHQLQNIFQTNYPCLYMGTLIRIISQNKFLIDTIYKLNTHKPNVLSYYRSKRLRGFLNFMFLKNYHAAHLFKHLMKLFPCAKDNHDIQECVTRGCSNLIRSSIDINDWSIKIYFDAINQNIPIEHCHGKSYAIIDNEQNLKITFNIESKYSNIYFLKQLCVDPKLIIKYVNYLCLPQYFSLQDIRTHSQKIYHQIIKLYKKIKNENNLRISKLVLTSITNYYLYINVLVLAKILGVYNEMCMYTYKNELKFSHLPDTNTCFISIEPKKTTAVGKLSDI